MEEGGSWEEGGRSLMYLLCFLEGSGRVNNKVLSNGHCDIFH